MDFSILISCILGLLNFLFSLRIFYDYLKDNKMTLHPPHSLPQKKKIKKRVIHNKCNTKFLHDILLFCSFFYQSKTLTILATINLRNIKLINNLE